MLAQKVPAGVPDGLSPDELERWSNELVAFLTSDGVPANFREWARTHADLLDAYMASAEDLDAEFDAGDDEDDAAPAPAAPPKQASPRAAKAGREQAAVAPESRDIVLRVPAQFGKLGAGVVIGALALLAIFGVRALASGGGGGSLPTMGTPPAFNQQRANELQTLLQQNPSNQDALFELGEMNFEAARYEDSISWLSKLVALNPADKQALNDIGTANFNLGRADEAKVWWQKTLGVDANDVQAHYNMGFVYANAEPRDLAGAVNEWETVVRLDPTSQLGQTAKVHVDGLKAQLAVTPAASSAAATTTLATPTAVAATP
jgi:tetratricopeptide (TPR) repeat protein